MKKILLTIVSAVFLTCCLLFATSCADTLDEPGNFKLDQENLVLSWDLVLGARDYTTVISGQDFEKSTKYNKLDLEALEPGTYEIKVKANGDGIETEDSDWAIYQFTRETESGLKYKLINGNTEYQLVGLGTASGDVVMDDTYRGKPVTSIADKAFSGNTRITSFKVGKNVKSIGKNAFARCAELVSVTFHEECVITEIGDHCFQSCKKLESFSFPDTVTKVSPYIFSWCSALKDVKIGANTTVISMYAFSSCEALESITLPNTVTLIEEYAFSDCVSLVDIDLGGSVETIQSYAFYNCEAFTTIDLGSALKTICYYAFGNCISLESIVIPDSCETIEHEAFRYCSSLAEVDLGSNLKYLGHGIFFNTKIYGPSDKEAEDYNPELIIDGWYIYCKDREIDKVNIPAGVYGIADSAFYMCKNIEDIKVTGVKYVGDSAFYGCENLWYVSFDNALISIGAYTFKDCKNITAVTFGNSLKTIGDYAFSKCEKLQAKNVDLPDSVTTIGTGAFKNIKYTSTNDGIYYVDDWAVGANVGPGSGFAVLNIRAGVRGIANYAFSKVPVISSIVIPDSVEYIGRGAFYQSASAGYLVSVTMPVSLKSIGDYAFYGCYCATFDTDNTLNIPSGTTYIGRSAFYGCESIYSLNIPGTVKEIGVYAFYGCKNIGAVLGEGETAKVGSFTLGEGIEIIKDRAFQGCTSITSIVIPDSVKTIGIRAFYKCEGVKNVTLGSGITHVPDYAFYNCFALEELTIKDGTTHIGRYAFKGCASLVSLELGNTVTSIGDFAFFGAEKLTKLIVPDSVKSIGAHAFRGMTYAGAIMIPDSVETVGMHAFYGAVSAVIYCEAADIPSGWNARWNSSYAPVIVGCTLSEGSDYPVSFVKSKLNPNNVHEIDEFPAPVRDGYTFAGFATSADGNVEYTLATFKDAKDGTVLYFVWQ